MEVLLLDLSKNIKKYRKEKELTQKELAEKIGVSTITIQNYENNRREPNVETLTDIATALGINIKNLFESTITESNSYKLILLIEKITHNKYGKSGKDYIARTLMAELNLESNETIYDVMNDKTIELPEDLFVKVLGYLEKLDKNEYLTFCAEITNLTNLSNYDMQFLIDKKYIVNGNLKPGIVIDIENRTIVNGDEKIMLAVPFEEMKEKVDITFPSLAAEIKFLSDPNVQKTYNYSFDELAKQGGYQELLLLAIENAIKNTINDIKNHVENGDIFDGVSSWISKDSPLYKIIKSNKEE